MTAHEQQFVWTVATSITMAQATKMSLAERLKLLVSYDVMVRERWSPHEADLESAWFTTPDPITNRPQSLVMQWVIDLPLDHPAWTECVAVTSTVTPGAYNGT